MNKPFPQQMAHAAIGLLLLTTSILHAETSDELDRRIKLPRIKGTLYQALAAISHQSGYLFIYGEETIRNDQPSEIKPGTYSIRRAIHTATSNPNLELRIIGNHLLIRQPDPPPADAPPSDALAIEGTLIDAYTGEAIPYATVGIPSNGIGTISNNDGGFRLRIPDTLRHSTLRISHLGYLTTETNLADLAPNNPAIRLEPKVISIQEIIVRLVNPQRLLDEMRRNRPLNYPSDPVYLTTFYREGVQRRKGFVNLTEAIFKIYKAPLGHNLSDQVKLLKMRRISNEKERDTLLLKMKSGVSSCLMLDIIQNPADFLTTESHTLYNYLQYDITEIDGRTAYVISFEQKPTVNDPHYTGELYIDAENSALLSARFEIHPQHIEQATSMFVTRKSRNITVKAKRAVYLISYRRWNNKYYISHIRGDLHFTIRKTTRLFSTPSPIHTWFEMATCRIDPDSVSRFPRNETLRTRTIFADTRFQYDPTFWNDFNIILPEDRLNEAIRKINAKIEEEGI